MYVKYVLDKDRTTSDTYSSDAPLQKIVGSRLGSMFHPGYIQKQQLKESRQC
jgi:hypothetical protein